MSAALMRGLSRPKEQHRTLTKDLGHLESSATRYRNLNRIPSEGCNPNGRRIGRYGIGDADFPVRAHLKETSCHRHLATMACPCSLRAGGRLGTTCPPNLVGPCAHILVWTLPGNAHHV